MKKSLFLLFALLLWCLVAPCSRGPEAALASFTPVSDLVYPADNATGVDGTRAFEWSAVPGADCYYIWLGKTLGEKDIWESGELQTTSKTVDNLPVGVKIYARMWTKYQGLWRYSDSSFTLASTHVVEEFTPVSNLTYPADNATGVDGTKAFEWSTVAGADCYYIWLGKTLGEKDIWESGELQITSKTVDNLPVGVKIYARMWTKYQGLWRYSDSSFTLASTHAVVEFTPVSNLTYPADNATAADGTKAFAWSAVTGADCYYIWLGKTLGEMDIWESGELQITSKTVDNLPVGVKIYARMWTKYQGLWRYSDSSFTLASTHVAAPVSNLTYPADNATAVDGTKAFAWSAVAGADCYYIWLGKTLGEKDIWESGELQTTSKTVDNLPVGAKIYARMWTKYQGLWRYSDSSFTLTNTKVDITLTFPRSGAVEVDGTKPFTWTPVAGAQAYYLYLGSSPGAKDLYDGGQTQLTSIVVPNLPVEQTIHARTWVKFAGLWYHSDSSFTLAKTKVDITLTYPPSGATDVDGTKPFTWTSVAGAQAYYLYLGSSHGAKDLYDSGQTQLTKKLVPNLPVDRLIYARTWVEYGGLWYYSDSSFALAKTKVDISLNYPPSGATDADGTKPFTWTPVAGAQAYYLYLGSSPGAKDLYDGGQTQLTSIMVPNLPVGQTIYARTWVKFAGLWYHSDSSFTLTSTSVEFIYPHNGAVGVDAAVPFSWKTVPGAQSHYLYVGTTVGGKDIYESGEIHATSWLVTGLLWKQKMYARIWTKFNNLWYYNDITFICDKNPELDVTTAPTATLLYPQSGMTDVDSAKPFQWAPFTSAQGYYLLVGTSPGAGDLHDSGEMHVDGLTSVYRFVGDLPRDVPLYARLYTKINDSWRYEDISFSVSTNGSNFENKLQIALWATSQVRSMTDSDDLFYVNPQTELYYESQGQGDPNCAALSRTLLKVLKSLNTGDARLLQIAFALEGHTLVELYNENQQEWMLLDPTFNFSMKRAADGKWATADDMHQATLGQQWDGVDYVYLGNSPVAAYYVDYPLLFLNLNAIQFGVAETDSAVPYLEEVSLPVDELSSYVYILKNETPLGTLLVDGVNRTIEFYGMDLLSQAMSAASIHLPLDITAKIRAFKIRRYRFL